MKLMPFLAMICVTLICYENATDGKVHIFPIEYSWMWFIVGLIWLVYAIKFMDEY